MAITVDCEFCGKQWRVKDRFAGRTIHCKACEARIDVPGQVATAPNGGTFSDAGAIAPKRGKPRRLTPADIRQRKTALASVSKGLLLLFWSLILRVGLLLAATLVLWLTGEQSSLRPFVQNIAPPLVTAVALVGELLCLRVPTESKCKWLIAIALGIDLTVFAVAFLPAAGSITEWIEFVTGLLWPVSTVFFVLFMRGVAVHIEQHDLVIDAEKIFGLAIGVVVLYVVFNFARAFAIGMATRRYRLVIFLGAILVFGVVTLLVRYANLMRFLRLAIEGYY